MEQQSDRKMKRRSRKRGEKNKGKREKGRFGPHACQLCKLKVSAASHVPLKKGDIYRRLALQLMEPCSVTPSNIIIIRIIVTLLCKKNGKCQQPERSSETLCVHVLCLAAS